MPHYPGFPFRFGPGPCCCPCYEWSDNFDRANNTNLGDDWTEVAEDSAIHDDALQVPAGGMVIATQAHFDETMVVSVLIPGVNASGDLPAAAQGDVYRLILSYTDEDNYLFAEVDCTLATFQSLAPVKACEMRLGAVTVLDEINMGLDTGPARLYACRSLDGLFVWFRNEELAVWGCISVDGKQYGVENASASNTVKFDNFEFSEHWVTNTDCPKCMCDCDGHCVPKTLKLTITASGDCSDLNGQEIDLINDTTTPAFRWTGTKLLQGVYNDEPDVTWTLHLDCVAGGECTLFGGQWRLLNEISGTGPADCNDGGGWYPVALPYTCPVDVECDPFQAEYGPFTCEDNPEIPTGLCTMSFTITE